MSDCGSDHNLLENPIRGQLGCFRVCFASCIFMKTKTTLPTPWLVFYHITGGSLSLPAPRCSHRPRVPRSARSQSCGGAGSAGIGLPEAVRQGPGPPSPAPVGAIQIQPMATCKQTRAPPPMNNTSGRREAHATPRGMGAGLSGGHTPRPGPMGGQTPPPALAALRT